MEDINLEKLFCDAYECEPIDLQTCITMNPSKTKLLRIVKSICEKVIDRCADEALMIGESDIYGYRGKSNLVILDNEVDDEYWRIDKCSIRSVKELL